MRRTFIVALASLSLVACGGDSNAGEGGTDAGGVPEASGDDAANANDGSALHDTGGNDATATDASADDASADDASAQDAGIDDATAADSNSDAEMDADVDDASANDASAQGVDDAAPNDASTSDAAMDDAAMDDGVDAASVPYPAPFPAPPQVMSAGGPVLASPRFVPVFFAEDDANIVSQLEDFTSKIGATSLWAGLAEYGVGAATATPSVMLTEPAPAKIDDSAIQTWLGEKLNGDDPLWPAADANTVYVLYYPAGTTITMDGSQSCSFFGGYHSSITLDAAHASANVAYAVLARCDEPGALTGIDAITAAASHELEESATDPYPLTTPAYDRPDDADLYWALFLGGGEVSDLCAQFSTSFTKFADLPYTVQRYWSNDQAVAGHDPCTPSLPGEVYFNAAPVLPDEVPVTYQGVTVMLRGVKIPVGASGTIPVQLFSDGPTSGPWTVSAIDGNAAFGLPASLAFSFDKTTGVNGDVVNLTITVKNAGAQNTETFLVQSTLGSTKHLWLGVVGN